MRRIAVIFFLLAVVKIFAAETDDETRARKAAFELAGAFANDEFKTRDGHWSGTVSAQQPALIAVNLYAGNRYWFSVGTANETRKVAVKVFDETGRQVSSESAEGDGAEAAGVSPTNSGQYFVSISVQGEPVTCCLLYSYK
jgi:hypothetical protein